MRPQCKIKDHLARNLQYQAAPLQAEFEIADGQATIMSPADLAFMVVPVAAAFIGGIIFLLRKKM